MKQNKNKFPLEGKRFVGKIKDHNGKEFFLFEKKTFFVLAVGSFLALVVYFFGTDARQFLTSVVSPLPEHTPYDGVTLPLKEAPDWTKLTEAERKLSYSQIPREKFTPIPEYIPERLSISYESLQWGNPEHQRIRNEKITFTVPYLGNYELDGRENVGSHPAVDIKIPSGTPVHAIGNGVVIKAAMTSGGFGNHIVIQHNNFPSPDDPSIRGTIFSSYSHLEGILVADRQVVTKGQLIGYSGNSGLSTTPHLHFQIDRDTSDWHPFWPFTSAEVREAGLTFFQALNTGFQKDRAVLNTINPLKYIQKYRDSSQLIASVVIPAPPPSAVESPYRFTIQTVNAPFTERGEAHFLIRITDKSGTIMKRQVFDDRIKVELRSGLGDLNRGFLSSGFFMSGETEAVTVTNVRQGKEKLILRFQNEEFTSEEFEILPKTPVIDTVSSVPASTPSNQTPEVLSSGSSPAAVMLPLGKSYMFEDTKRMLFPRFEVTLDRKSVTVGERVNGMVQYFDANAHNVTPEIDQPIFLVPLQGDAEITPNIVRRENFVDGKILFTLLPRSTGPVLIQAVGAGLIGFGELLEVSVSQLSVPQSAPPSPVFTDIPQGHELEIALRLLKERGVIKGYPDGSFQADRPVLRVEALKMIFEALSSNVTDVGSLLFPDLQPGAWYLPFVEKAYREAVVKGYPDGTFRPNANVNMVEFYKMLFLAAKTDINPDIIIQLPNGVKPDDWFAPYLQEAIRKNILEIKEDPLQPGKAMTRGDIAKALYNLLKS